MKEMNLSIENSAHVINVVVDGYSPDQRGAPRVATAFGGGRTLSLGGHHRA